MSNCESVVMLDFLPQLAYWWAKAQAKEKYGTHVRKTRICNPDAFAHPANEKFEMALFVDQTSKNSEKAILWRRWYGGDAPETKIFEYVVNSEDLAPEVLNRLIEAGKDLFVKRCK